MIDWWANGKTTSWPFTPYPTAELGHESSITCLPQCLKSSKLLYISSTKYPYMIIPYRHGEMYLGQVVVITDTVSCADIRLMGIGHLYVLSQDMSCPENILNTVSNSKF